MFGMKKMTQILWIFAVLITKIFELSSLSAGEFDFYMDYARFSGPRGFGYLEIYFGIPRDQLEYTASDSVFQAEFEIRTEIYEADSLVSTQTWQNQDQVPSLDAVQTGQTLQDLSGLYLKPGAYSIHARVQDLKNRNQKEKVVDIQIPYRVDDRLSMSDIELALYIQRDPGESKFNKNGYRILPNPGRVYTASGPILYYYLEIYGLSSLETEGDSTYTVSIDLQNDGSLIRKIPDKTKIRSASSLVELGNLHVGALNTAAYSLNVNVVDHGANDTVSTKIFFYVYRQQDLVQSQENRINTDYSRDIEFLSMNEETLNEHFEYAKYIATRNEANAYKKLDLSGKRKFMQEFWQKRDSNVMTLQNEFKDEYYFMLRLARQKYSTPNLEGWETDRGRVLILYGEPDDIKRYTSGNWGKPYEMWQYFKLEGGVEFIFADESGYGDYNLIHSTATNEIQDYDWEDRLN